MGIAIRNIADPAISPEMFAELMAHAPRDVAARRLFESLRVSTWSLMVWHRAGVADLCASIQLGHEALGYIDEQVRHFHAARRRNVQSRAGIAPEVAEQSRILIRQAIERTQLAYEQYLEHFNAQELADAARLLLERAQVGVEDVGQARLYATTPAHKKAILAAESQGEAIAASIRQSAPVVTVSPPRVQARFCINGKTGEVSSEQEGADQA